MFLYGRKKKRKKKLLLLLLLLLLLIRGFVRREWEGLVAVQYHTRAQYVLIGGIFERGKNLELPVYRLLYPDNGE